MPTIRFTILLLALLFARPLLAQKTIVREWQDALLLAMQEDLARPHVQARTMFHLSVAFYDAWAAYDDEAGAYLLGKNVNGYTCPCKGVPKAADPEAARREAMSFAAYRILSARFMQSPQSTSALFRFRDIMKTHGYDFRNYSLDYASGSPAALGNYIAQCVLQMGMADGAHEDLNYLDPTYRPVNPPLEIAAPHPFPPANPNHWQPLKLNRAIDYDGYPVAECRCLGRPFSSLLDSVDKDGRVRFTGTQSFQGTHWGGVASFSGKKQEMQTYRRGEQAYRIWKDPGADFFPQLDTLKGGGTSKEFQWNFALVAAWSALLDPADTARWDVSPRSMGNLQAYPQNLAGLRDFYDLKSGRDPGAGRALNPRTGKPYAAQRVSRADFLRAAVQYWAEGPNAETPPGHWLGLLHYVSDQPGLVKKFNGKGQVLSDLEWDVKAGFTLSAALHDAAIAAWGVKARYEGPRPVTALRYLAARGQCTDPKLPSYHPAGIPLIPGRIELVKKGDPLAGPKNAQVGKIKFYAWKGPFAVEDPTAQVAGAGWILAENWFPYQSKSFISPPFGGFVSGHAAFSHAAATALSLLTGDEYFPGGLGEFKIAANNQFLRVEKGPATEVVLQWATYRDAADQASLSRVWGGANAPFDDIPGRRLGMEVGTAAFRQAAGYFYKDADRDGVLRYEDCDDTNATMYPGAPELCDGLDNDCNGKVDDVTPPCTGGQ